MFEVFVLYSSKFNKYYIGQTEDLEKRFERHNYLSVNSYTSKYRPWKLFGDESQFAINSYEDRKVFEEKIQIIYHKATDRKRS